MIKFRTMYLNTEIIETAKLENHKFKITKLGNTLRKLSIDEIPQFICVIKGQMAIVGPMIGQHHQFPYYHQGKSEWGEKRYFKITRKIYEDLEARLAQSKFLANDKYSIADIATWSWIARHKRHDIGLNNFKNLSSWFVEIAERPAVVKGFKALNKDAEIDFP